MRRVTARAPGKVNIQLAVGAARADGYHELATVFHAVNLFGEVVAQEVPAGSGLRIAEVTGPQSELVPRDSTNLAWRAAELLADVAQVPADASLSIRKEIPVAGGMAGGSADCAAALVAVDALWGTRLNREELATIAAELGSDVPFALLGGTAQGLGRGEQLTSLMVRGEFHWVFATSFEGLSTPSVYAQFDRLAAGRAIPAPRISPAVISALISGDPQALGDSLSNDLQAAAISLRPRLERVRQIGLEAGACGAIVSGSGPTVALLAPDAGRALDVAVTLSGSGLVKSVLRTTGPAPGARVIAG